MDTALVVTGLAGATFVLSHLGLAGSRLRGRLVARLGENGFQGLYVLLAALALGILFVAYRGASHHVDLWSPGPVLCHLPLLAMPLALILIAGGALIPDSSATRMTDVLERSDLARGVLRVTRHPVMWGVGLWAAVHILANGDLASLLFFGSFLLTALVGAWHLDRAMATTGGERWRHFAAVTSFLPFAALLTGRQRWAWAEWRQPMAWGLGLFVLLFFLHFRLFGVRPY
ncbi:MAG: NnrU family protein [Candidatus Competibacteraceae bacterium]